MSSYLRGPDEKWRSHPPQIKPKKYISVTGAHFIYGLQFIPDIIKLTTKNTHHRGKLDWDGRQDMIEERNNIHV